MPSALSHSYGAVFWQVFLGHSSPWYKKTILAFLLINPIVYWVNPYVAGWLLVVEFIFTLSMALKCYPLQPGGLLALEAVLLGLTNTESVYKEVSANFPVILLLIFMVAGIYFMKDLLLFVFTKILLSVRSKTALSLIFCLLSAGLSAFLDALTVTAVLINIAIGFYAVYHRVASGFKTDYAHNHQNDEAIRDLHRADLDQFRAFLRSLIMHGAVGTALGGVCTLVGEPQNIVIGQRLGWDFADFFINMAPVSLPALLAGVSTCWLLEKTRLFGYGTPLPESVRDIIVAFEREKATQLSDQDKLKLCIQAMGVVVLVLSLAFHVAEVGLIGLLIIVLMTAFTGVTEEHQIGRAFVESLPFAALLVVFFVIVAVIHDQHLFRPILVAVLALEDSVEVPVLFLVNGALSMISDNVFVATVYITEVEESFRRGDISREHFEQLAIAINTGTNLPSVATPNGQAAFLFLLTSALAPLIRLSYVRMVWMALPYTLVLTAVGVTMVAVMAR